MKFDIPSVAAAYSCLRADESLSNVVYSFGFAETNLPYFPSIAAHTNPLGAVPKLETQAVNQSSSAAVDTKIDYWPSTYAHTNPLAAESDLETQALISALKNPNSLDDAALELAVKNAEKAHIQQQADLLLAAAQVALDNDDIADEDLPTFSEDLSVATRTCKGGRPKPKIQPEPQPKRKRKRQTKSKPIKESGTRNNPLEIDMGEQASAPGRRAGRAARAKKLLDPIIEEAEEEASLAAGQPVKATKKRARSPEIEESDTVSEPPKAAKRRRAASRAATPAPPPPPPSHSPRPPSPPKQPEVAEEEPLLRRPKRSIKPPKRYESLPPSPPKATKKRAHEPEVFEESAGKEQQPAPKQRARTPAGRAKSASVPPVKREKSASVAPENKPKDAKRSEVMKRVWAERKAAGRGGRDGGAPKGRGGGAKGKGKMKAE